MNKTIIALASKLPAGLNDQRAPEKFNREFAELQDELRKGDRLGALLECADCLYYATKAQYNGLMSAAEAEARMSEIYKISNFTSNQVEAAALAKYSLRARPGNPKDDRAERAAVTHLIQE
jgi:hypothetical protein